jgi:hypothetical protein
MPDKRPSDSPPRHSPRGKDFEREGRFQRDDKPGRGASGTARSPDASSPGTRLSPRKPGPSRGESTGAKPASRSTKPVSRSKKPASPPAKAASRSGPRGRRAST